MMLQQQQEEEEEEHHQPQKPLMLPLGYKFLPTDRELLFHFLKNKLKDPTLFLPASIQDIQLYDHHPQIILDHLGVQGNNNNLECYVFTMRSRKYLRGKRPNRVLKDNVGYWRSSYSHEQIQERRRCGEGGGGLVGERMNFAFFSLTTSTSTTSPASKNKKGIKTDWLMNEYMIKSMEEENDGAASTTGEDLVLCRIYINNKRRNNSSSNHHHQQQQQQAAVQQYEQPYLQQQQEQEQQPAAVATDQVSDARTTYSIDTEIDSVIYTDSFWEMMRHKPQPQQPGTGV